MFVNLQFQEHAGEAGSNDVPNTGGIQGVEPESEHEMVMTTFINYGVVETSRQGELIRGVTGPLSSISPEVHELAQALARELM